MCLTFANSVYSIILFNLYSIIIVSLCHFVKIIMNSQVYKTPYTLEFLVSYPYHHTVSYNPTSEHDSDSEARLLFVYSVPLRCELFPAQTHQCSWESYLSLGSEELLPNICLIPERSSLLSAAYPMQCNDGHTCGLFNDRYAYASEKTNGIRPFISFIYI